MAEKRPTALITGASSGIGAVFAREYASRGHNLVIAARRTNRLDALAAEITAAHGVSVRVIASDLSVPGAAQKLADAVGKTPIDVLINNSGWGQIGAFAAEDLDGIVDEINVNVVSLT
ncbi:MAG: hypothetical protein RL107_357, partial [Actinomycetota bacterium]